MNSKRTSPHPLTVAAVLCGAATTLHADEPEPLPLWGAFLGGIGSDARVTLNGFPLFTAMPDEQDGRNETLNRFLVAGENRFLVTFFDVPPDEVITPGDGDPPPPFASHFRIVMETQEPEAEEAAPLFKIDRQLTFSPLNPLEGIEIVDTSGTDDWNTETRAFLNEHRRSAVRVDPAAGTHAFAYANGAATSTLDFVFNIGAFPVDSLPWNAPYTAPGAGERADLADTIEAIHTAIVARDMAAFTASITPKLERTGVALGLTTQTVAASLAASYDTLLFSAPGLAFVPLNKANITFEQVDDLNLIEARVGEAAPIRAASEEIEFELRLFFSRIDGAWTLVE